MFNYVIVIVTLIKLITQYYIVENNCDVDLSNKYKGIKLMTTTSVEILHNIDMYFPSLPLSSLPLTRLWSFSSFPVHW